ELSDYKQEVENSKKRKLENNPETNQFSKKNHTTVESDNRIETDYNSDPQIESSTQNQINNQYSEIDSDSENEFSELDSDDSEYTCQQKKGKFKENKNLELNNLNEINAIQEVIKANHIELNLNRKRNRSFDEFLITEDDINEDHKLVISDISKKNKKIKVGSDTVDKLDKSNSLYL
ncbi:25481_t:CDS:1, partial [Dentiscutata erythropus]